MKPFLPRLLLEKTNFLTESDNTVIPVGKQEDIQTVSVHTDVISPHWNSSLIEFLTQLN